MSKIEVNTVAPQCGTTLTLGESGDTVTLGSGANQSGFGRTGTVDWQTTKKTTAFTAANGEGYFVDTAASGAVTMTLPASPSAGNIVAVKDYNGNFAVANLTIGRNGSPINGGNAADVVIDTAGASIVLVYVDATQGWVATQDDNSIFSGQSFMVATGGNSVTTCGNCKIHTFTGPGTFTVCSVASCASNNIVSYLVVAGAGGGGGSATGYYSGGGGGAGGFRELKNPVTPYTASPLDGYPSAPNRITVTATGFPIAVGAGGTNGGGSNSSASPPGRTNATNGNVSTFSTISSAGGGLGAKSGSNPAQGGQAGGDGGSGGGAGGYGPGSGGAGNTPPVTPPQGGQGGTGQTPTGGHGGGGGGATAAGANGDGSRPDHDYPGGAGGTTNITGSPVTYSKGGNSGENVASLADSGAVNTGDGGQGGNNNPSSANGGSGGSGIVIIRYKFQ